MSTLRALWFQEIKEVLISYKIVMEKHDREQMREF